MANLRPGVVEQAQGRLAKGQRHRQGERFRVLRRAGRLRGEKWKQQSHRGSRMAAHVPDRRKVSRDVHDAGPGAGVSDRFNAAQDVHEAGVRHHVRDDYGPHKAQVVLDDRGERQAVEMARLRDGGVFVEAAQLVVSQHQPERARVERLLHQG